MAYADRIVWDGGIETTIPVTNEWIKEYKSNRWLLITDKIQIASDDIETATVTLQRITAPLLDASHENVLGIGSVRFGVVGSDDLETIDIDANGTGTETITSDTIGIFQLATVPDDGESNIIEIEVI